MKVLVAGGAGYLGSILVPHLLGAGHEVTVLDRMYFGSTLDAVLKHPKLRIKKADTRSFDPSLLEGIEGVIDLAGISNDPSCELAPELTRHVNVEGATRLAALAKTAGVRRYAYASSCSVYGHGEGLGLVETSRRHPVSLYAKAKADMEDVLFSMRAPMFEPVALRLATLFGVSTRMRFDLAINVMTKNAYVARRITVDGGGRQWRPFVHVADAARAFALVLSESADKVSGRVFNVGAKENNTRILNLAFRVRDAVPGTEIVHAPTDPDLRDYHVAFDTIEQELGFKANVSLDDGIREVHEALRAGTIDPDERRAYTLRQYVFLLEAERAMRDLGIEGGLLTTATSLS